MERRECKSIYCVVSVSEFRGGVAREEMSAFSREKSPHFKRRRMREFGMGHPRSG